MFDAVVVRLSVGAVLEDEGRDPEHRQEGAGGEGGGGSREEGEVGTVGEDGGEPGVEVVLERDPVVKVRLAKGPREGVEGAETRRGRDGVGSELSNRIRNVGWLWRGNGERNRWVITYKGE